MAENELTPPSNLPTPGAGHRVNAVIWVLISLSTVFLGLRVFYKLKTGRGLWLDDWVLTASWLVLIASGVLISLCVSAVFIRHNQDDRMGAHDVGMLSTVAGTLFFVSATWSKTSFAITLFRIAGPRLKIALRVIMISMNIITYVSLILRWVQCRPARMIWDSHAAGVCWNRNLILSFTIFTAAYSAVMDFVLAALPWPIIIKLRIRTSEKIGISVAMSMGLCAGITSIVKCTKFSVLRNDDFGDSVFELAIWSVAEIATTIMAASIPVLRCALMHEAAGSIRLTRPLTFIRDRSQKVASKVRSNNPSLSASRRSKMVMSPDNFVSEERAALGSEDGIPKMDGSHVQLTRNGVDDAIDPELERGSLSDPPWV
uniref:Decarboxylase_GME6026 n=1 Tax=Daldinia eschscholzii IFB-TL01 TaxID=1169046 RepID=A0A0X9F6Z9_9PEZI|nr:decarboxylase_GME6026 [Daldinia eschscholzii IFB-TL01]